MKEIQWSEAKNDLLKQTRGISFHDVVTALEQGKLLAHLRHPNQKVYAHQHVLIVVIDNYAYIVPFIEEKKYIFLKTIIPSRKMTKQYLSI